MDVAESRSAAPPLSSQEDKESRSLDESSSSEQQLLDPVTKELKSQLPLDGGEKVSSVARWQNLIPSFPFQGKEGFKFRSIA